MTALIAAFLPVIQQLVKSYPDIKVWLKDILEKDDPTDADWDALEAKVRAKDYFAHVPESKLPRI